jgi:hypothetical protein
MFGKRVNRFNAVTQSPKLFHKSIQQIDLDLLEAFLVNDGQILLAKGAIKRQIKYYEFDGRLRKIEDQIQFAIYMGESVTEPLSLLQTELQQDYFAFQPRGNGANAAILEQGFLLTVSKLETIATLPKVNMLQVNSIIAQGQESTIIKIPFKSLVAFNRPKIFTGQIRFIDYSSLPVVVAEINGIVTERTLENLLQETPLHETVSLFVNGPAPNLKQTFFIFGNLKDVDVQIDTVGSNEYMSLPLDYRWYLTEPKELPCMAYCNESNLPTEQIQTVVCQGSRSFNFVKSIMIALPDSTGEIKLDLEKPRYTNTLTQKGLLLNANLTWGLTFTNLNGVEQYQEFQTKIDELFPGVAQEYQDLKHTWTAELQVELTEYTTVSQKLTIIFDCQYHFKTYEKQIATIVEDGTSPELIYAKTWLGEESYSLMVEEWFELKHSPLKIIGVTGRLLEVSGEPKNGRLAVNGNLEVSVAYIDRERVVREELFPSLFKDLYIWDKLKPQMEVEVTGNLDYNHYRFMNMNINYQYIVSISVKAFHEKVLRVGIVKSSTSVGSQYQGNLNLKPSHRGVLENLWVEGEIPLRKGSAKEIAKSRVLLSRFNYQNSHNAVLIKGNLSGELEYWDHKQYLQKVAINLPFWRFIRNDSGLQLEHCKLSPLIRDCNFYPSVTMPWQKGSIKICFQLGFDQTWEDEII